MDGKDNRWRFLNTGPGDAFFNMALDEAILSSVRKGKSPPTLRVYRWNPPAVSFGYAQPVDRKIELERCKKMGIDIVRRITGGRAVLHWEELTYSVIAPLSPSGHIGQSCSIRFGGPFKDHHRIEGSLESVYKVISQCLLLALRSIGIPAEFECVSSSGRRNMVTSFRSGRTACFASASKYEITVGGRKLVGSAQRRVKNTMLQHGSILMGPAHKAISEILRRDSDKFKTDLKEELDRTTVSLSEISSSRIGFDQLGCALKRGFEEHLDVEMICEEPTSDEFQVAEILSSKKYGSQKWNLQRTPAGLQPQSESRNSDCLID